MDTTNTKAPLARIQVRRGSKGRIVGWMVSCDTCGGLVVPVLRSKAPAEKAAYDHATEVHNRDATISS